MNARVQNHITGRLSLRPPQAESLNRLTRAIACAPELMAHERDLANLLASLKAEFPTLEDFEREFPSLCFSLATGVGKTRLMGAFVAYLHLAHNINNFFVLAPNLTIYNKLIADFTPNTPKYVFKGIAEFAQQPPLIITGDNYDQSGAVVSDTPRGFAHDVRINIFNISKINSEVRGGKEPRIKRMKEVLGDSYFDHLATLNDLVLLMDESHRYRASAGVRAINDLNPLFGLEVTATPFVETTRAPLAFKNVIMDYPLGQALNDGFVKAPAVVTQRNFNAKEHSADEIENIKLQDGVRVHEATKVELLTYARENGVKIVKPFMLVIARDTTHAKQLFNYIESGDFYDGRYDGKVIQVDSSKSGAEEEEMITRLLAVESVDEPTEIVIHVNMLKEGWDVTNLYTIVPLRAANARTLVEQSIGRGLRLPYGKRTGVPAVDRLNIVAHDRFQEIIDDCNRSDSPIKLQTLILDAPKQEDKQVSRQVNNNAMTMLTQTVPGATADVADVANVADLADVADVADPSEIAKLPTNNPPPPIFYTRNEQDTALMVASLISKYEVQQVASSSALSRPEVQAQLVAQVKERMRPLQGELLEGADAQQPPLDIAAVVAKTTALIISQTIDIPRIFVQPTGAVTTGFHAFKLNLAGLNLQPGEREIVLQDLHTHKQTSMMMESEVREKRLEDYIVHALIDFDDIDYPTHATLLYDLAGQLVQHLQSYLTEAETHNVLNNNRRLIANEVHSQMMAHFWEQASDYEVTVKRGFTELKPCNYTVSGNEPIRNFRETLAEPGRIRQMLFGHFKRCLYPLQKFDSDTERRFAIILERDANKWLKPAKGQFNIYYKLGSEQHEYLPDFVAETDEFILMIETKARGEVDTQDAQVKAAAATRWCEHASQYATSLGNKPWRYILLPHDEVTEARRLRDCLRFEGKR